MTIEARIHENDIGTKFDLTIKDENDDVVDVSEATTKQIIFQKPDEATNLAKPATFITNGIDGGIRYVSVALDLTPNGKWTCQAYVVTPGGTWCSNIKTFIVYKNL